MAAHIFTVTEENYKICIRRGLVAIPEPKESSIKNNVFDGLLSRLACIRDGDYILLYVIGKKELHGVWEANGLPFYEESPVWPDRMYPFRCRIRLCDPHRDYSFANSLVLNDINDMRNNGQLWTWALQRASGSNSMFSITDAEFAALVHEYRKINPFKTDTWCIEESYPERESNILSYVHKENGSLKFEYSVMTYLNAAFSQGKYTELFGNYTDFLSYVPTSLGREMDILLLFGLPNDPTSILSYDIIEVKRSKFDEDALRQLIDYESWFLNKKVSGDLKMLRISAIARSFSPSVKECVDKRIKFENKPIKLIEYKYDSLAGFSLHKL